jgi:gliding motility-associated-like protein
VYPTDGTTNVPLSPIISWEPVLGADGYFVSLGSTPGDNDILDNADLRGLTETGVLNFDPNRIYYLTLTAYNSAGVSIGCNQTTFSTIEGCGPYFDSTGELIDLRPQLSFPESIGICAGLSSNTVSATDPADGYRWYLVEPGGRERLLAETADFDIPGEGTYRHEIYNRYPGVEPGTEFECAASRVFEVVISEAPVIERAEVQLRVGTLDITVRVNGIGDYEYALNDPGGPYQASNQFTGLPVDSYRVYVRDKNGCGTADILVEPDLTVEGFPRFFTPNGDGANDTWNYIEPPSGNSTLVEISIFDRYGNLVSVLDPGDAGWDGTYGGRPLPPSDYWFRAVDRNGAVVQGHFTLKR